MPTVSTQCLKKRNTPRSTMRIRSRSPSLSWSTSIHTMLSTLRSSTFSTPHTRCLSTGSSSPGSQGPRASTRLSSGPPASLSGHSLTYALLTPWLSTQKSWTEATSSLATTQCALPRSVCACGLHACPQGRWGHPVTALGDGHQSRATIDVLTLFAADHGPLPHDHAQQQQVLDAPSPPRAQQAGREDCQQLV